MEKKTIRSRTLPHDKLKVLDTNGIKIDLLEDRLEYHEWTEVQAFEEDGPMGGMWDKNVWDNFIIIRREAINVINCSYMNERDFFTVTVETSHSAILIDCETRGQAHAVAKQFRDWVFNTNSNSNQ